jgi:hypothetical protein
VDAAPLSIETARGGDPYRQDVWVALDKLSPEPTGAFHSGNWAGPVRGGGPVLQHLAFMVGNNTLDVRPTEIEP